MNYWNPERDVSAGVTWTMPNRNGNSFSTHAVAFHRLLFTVLAVCVLTVDESRVLFSADDSLLDEAETVSSERDPMQLSDLIRMQLNAPELSVDNHDIPAREVPSVRLKAMVWTDVGGCSALLAVEDKTHVVVLRRSATGCIDAEVVLGGQLFRVTDFNVSGLDLERVEDLRKLKLR